ncbi:MAG TPA: 7-carboxy-7-deazaguanine synthase QueE [Kineosporiaceae bacterium]
MALPTAPDMLVVSEVLPATVVGDGPLAGWRCGMIRLGGCNLACSWCDVPHAWDGSHVDLRADLSRRLVHNIVDEALSASSRVILITGGEPLVQQRTPGWSALLESLSARGAEIEVHTNATLVPEEVTARRVHRFVVSPKLSHSGEPQWTRIRPDALQAWAAIARQGRVAFWFVVRDRMDVQTVATLCAVHGLPPELVWISAEGVTPSRLLEITADVAEVAIAHGFNLGTRVGVLAAVPAGAFA